MRRICKRISKVFGGGKIDYEIVRIDSDYGIYSVKVGESIGVNYHYGIKIGDTIYDNDIRGNEF